MIISKKVENDGFSLIELVVVIAVLSILSAVTIPSFVCMIRKSKAAAALAAINNVRKECIAKKLDQNNPQFNNSNLNGYSISDYDGGNECNSSNQQIVASPGNNEELPSFIYTTNPDSIKYSFKGITGTDVIKCLSFVCDKAFYESKNTNSALKSSLEANSFVIPETYVERECSAYVIVEGPTWEDAKNNAEALGGNLATINDKDEHEWVAKEFSKDKYGYDGDTNPGDPSNWTNLWLGGEYNTQEKKWTWGSGQEFGANGFEIAGENDPGLGAGTGKGTDSYDPAVYSKMLAHFNHNKDENQHTRHGQGEGSYYVGGTIGSSNDTRGIAEINTCN